MSHIAQRSMRPSCQVPSSRSEIRRGGSAAVGLALAIAVAVATTPIVAAAQQQQAARAGHAFDPGGAAHLRDAYLADLDTVHTKILALANAIPADKYSWRPTAGVRSVSEALMHVVSEWWYWTPRSVGGKEPADFGPPKTKLPALEKITSKAEVLDQLNKSWAYCASQVRAADPAHLTGAYKPWGFTLDAAAFAMAGDLHEHLGQLIAYSRSVGVTPPWSK